MKICKVRSDTVRVPELVSVLPMRFTFHVLHLTPREWDGKTVKAAYLRANDTLYIRDDG